MGHFRHGIKSAPPWELKNKGAPWLALQDINMSSYLIGELHSTFCVMMFARWLFYAVALPHLARSTSVERVNTHTGKWKAQLPIPSKYESPRFRYWWPGGWIDPDVVQNEVEAIAAAGFGGTEIGDVRDSITVKMDPKVYGWAGYRWNDGVLAAYKAADECVVMLCF